MVSDSHKESVDKLRRKLLDAGGKACKIKLAMTCKDGRVSSSSKTINGTVVCCFFGCCFCWNNFGKLVATLQHLNLHTVVHVVAAVV